MYPLKPYSSTLLSFTFLISIVVLCGCNQMENSQEKMSEKKVVIKKIQEGTYQMYRNGEPYFIKGAGGHTNLFQIKQKGGNSVRTWDIENAKEILDEAEKLGLSVTLGLPVKKPREGFNYSDEMAVKIQLKELKKVILKYKDHPALLMWGVGNEIHLLHKNNIKAWQSINEIAKMIHETDPNHPVTTMLAGIHTDLQILQVKMFCPELDLLSINIFGGISRVKREIRNYIWGWEGPYIISEWGAEGWWDLPKTPWGAPIEPSSLEKSNLYLKNYTQYIKGDSSRCLGSYVFYWGNKQERTQTMFSLLLLDTLETNMVEVMQYAWKNKWPSNKVPKIKKLSLNNKTAEDHIFFLKNESFTTQFDIIDADNDSLEYYWEIREEGVYFNINGGDMEARPELWDYRETRSHSPQVFRAPSVPGPYRIFLYVFDGKNHVATDNIPFYVLNENAPAPNKAFKENNQSFFYQKCNSR